MDFLPSSGLGLGESRNASLMNLFSEWRRQMGSRQIPPSAIANCNSKWTNNKVANLWPAHHPKIICHPATSWASRHLHRNRHRLGPHTIINPTPARLWLGFQWLAAVDDDRSSSRGSDVDRLIFDLRRKGEKNKLQTVRSSHLFAALRGVHNVQKLARSS